MVFICLRPRTPYHLPPYTLYSWRYFALVPIVVISPWDEESQVWWPSLHTSLPKQFVLKKSLYCIVRLKISKQVFLSFSKLLTEKESGFERLYNHLKPLAKTIYDLFFVRVWLHKQWDLNCFFIRLFNCFIYCLLLSTPGRVRLSVILCCVLW